jgi:acetyl esterase/lipase
MQSPQAQFLRVLTSSTLARRRFPVPATASRTLGSGASAALYPGHLWIRSALNQDIPVTRQTPPTFLNDDVDSVNNSLVYYIALLNAGVPVEMHLYAGGKHAFGLRRTQYPITRWPELVETWLRTIGLISP